MSRLFSIAGVQFFVQREDLKTNLANMQEAIGFVARNYPYVDLIVFPELALYGAPYPAWKKDALSIPGPEIEALADLARKYRKWLLPGSFYEKSDDGIYNTAVVLSPQGEIAARYRKLFPWQPQEQTLPGREFCVFEVPTVGKFGLCICYDMWVPEVCRTLSWMGAEVILHPTMTTSQDRDQELILTRANAIFNQVYFIDVNGTGWGGNGQSIFVDPHGRVLQQSGETPGVLIETIDLDLVTVAREQGVAGVSQILRQFVHTPLEYPVYKNIKGGEGFRHLAAPAIVRKK